MKIYISGPITGTDDYMDRFRQAEETLIQSGYTVINPARVNAQMPESTSYEEYMMMSLAMLRICDAIFVLEGWNKSKGAKMELEYAMYHGFNIFFEGGPHA